MENLSEHRDRVNKMESPSHDSLARGRINERRGTSLRRCKPAIKARLVARELYGVRTEALLWHNRRRQTGFCIACYGNFSCEQYAQQMSSREQQEDKTGNSRGSLASSRNN